MEQEDITVISPAGTCASGGRSRGKKAQGQTTGNCGTAKLWELKYRYIRCGAMLARLLEFRQPVRKDGFAKPGD